MKYTVKEFANLNKISEQAIYKRIARGTLKTVKENNRLFILHDEKPNKKQKSDNSEHKKDIEILKIENINLQKTISYLTNQIANLHEDKQFLKNQIKSLQDNLDKALDLQRENIEEKQQSNTLLAGLQNALGFFENKKNKVVEIDKNDVFDLEKEDRNKKKESKKEKNVNKNSKKSTKQSKKDRSKKKKNK